MGNQGGDKPNNYTGLVVDAEPVDCEPMISAPIGVGMSVMESNLP